MHYFLLPMVPLTIVGAIFFKKRFSAYGFAAILTLIKMLTTQVTPVYFFTGLGLCALVLITRKLNQPERISLVRAALTAAAGVLVYSLTSDFGVWFLGGCGFEERVYAFTFSGLLACYQAGLSYAGIHFLKAVPLTLVLVQAFQWMRQRNISLNLQRLASDKI